MGAAPTIGAKGQVEQVFVKTLVQTFKRSSKNAREIIACCLKHHNKFILPGLRLKFAILRGLAERAGSGGRKRAEILALLLRARPVLGTAL